MTKVQILGKKKLILVLKIMLELNNTQVHNHRAGFESGF